MKIQKKANNLIIIILPVLLLVFLAWVFIRKNDNQESKNNSSNIAKTEQSTKEEKRITNSNTPQKNKEEEPKPKDDTKKLESNNTDRAEIPKPENGKYSIKLSTSYQIGVDNIEIRGGSSILISNANCYAIFENSQNKRLKFESKTLENPSTTDCKTLSIPKSNFEKGEWKYQLIIESENTKGISDENTFEIK